MDNGTGRLISHDQGIGAGQVVFVPPEARVRLRLPNGDALHLGEGSLLDLKETQQGWSARFWAGAITIYATPGAGGHGRLETPDGTLDAGEGKLGAIVTGDGNGTTLYAFNNWRAWESKQKDAPFRLNAASMDWQVDAVWQGNEAQPVNLSAGSMLRIQKSNIRLTNFDPGIEVDLTYHTSPEAEALGEAVQFFEKGQTEPARLRFLQVQKAFPNNAMAAYYLGAIALDQGQHFETIRQWQQYIQTDPDGASRKGIPEKVTLLVNQELRAEVERAIKLEASLNTQTPEPGTVAVLPFVNRGDAAQAILSKGLAAMMISDLSKVPGLRVLERAKLQMLADEIALSGSGLVDEKSAVRAGRLMRAEKLLIGDYKVQDDGN